MNQKELSMLMKNLFDEVYTGHNVNMMDKYFAENVKFSDPAVPKFKGGLENLKKLELQYTNAFPDKKLQINNLILADNAVTVHWTCVATHKGNLGNFSATGNKVTIQGISIHELNPEGKISSVIQLWDRLALLEQIGQAKTLAL